MNGSLLPSILFLLLVLLVTFTTSEAFVTRTLTTGLSRGTAISQPSTSQLDAFWFGGGKKETPETTPAAKKQTAKKEKEADKNQEGVNKDKFIFLFGKPEYDWVKGETIPLKASRRHKWLQK